MPSGRLVSTGGGCASNRNPNDWGWGRESRPVITVSWDDAQEYVDWINGQVSGSPYRLPSEAEWEYAARAGTTTAFAFGETISTDQANYNGDSTYGIGSKGSHRRQTVAVYDLDAANAWGLRHMHGNVYERVQDCWHESYAGAPTDGSAWMAEDGGNCWSAILRGGSWNVSPQDLRSADRYGSRRGLRLGVVGFRVGRTLP